MLQTHPTTETGLIILDMCHLKSLYHLITLHEVLVCLVITLHEVLLYLVITLQDLLLCLAIMLQELLCYRVITHQELLFYPVDQIFLEVMHRCSQELMVWMVQQE
jgi:hypothetical protein